MSPNLVSASLSSPWINSSTRQSARQSGNNVHYTPKLPWREIESTQTNLITQMRMMYWAGVKREMAHILLTLRDWQQPKFASVVLDDENDDFIHGFDTF